MGQSILSDTELQHLLEDNDSSAFTILYDRYSNDIYAFLLRILKNPQISEDATQEVFTKIWINRGQLCEVRIFKAYLYTIARNHALTTLKLAFRDQTTTKDIFKSFISFRSSTEEDLLSKEYLSFVRRILATLPERTKEIFLLCREEGKSYEEVSQKMGISRNAVKNHMVHSMKVLRRVSEKELGISLTLLLAGITSTMY
ncbi:MAG: RNA polymerase sigma-70 factor [Pedobacter sp.]